MAFLQKGRSERFNTLLFRKIESFLQKEVHWMHQEKIEYQVFILITD
jgi:hypothetical protein